MKIIESIASAGDEPYYFVVGRKYGDKELTHILEHNETQGMYSLVWFVGYHYGEVLFKMQALHTLIVNYKELPHGTVFPPVPTVPAPDAGA